MPKSMQQRRDDVTKVLHTRDGGRRNGGGRDGERRSGGEEGMEGGRDGGEESQRSCHFD